MSENLISLLIGGGIAIVSGGLSHFLSNYFKSKTEKRRYVLGKLEDIITSVANLEQMMQEDIAGILRLSNPENHKKTQNITFEQKKLECLVNIYHKDLSPDFNELKNAINNYDKRKRTIIQLENSETAVKIIAQEYNGLSMDFTYFVESTENFIDRLSKYGNAKLA